MTKQKKKINETTKYKELKNVVLEKLSHVYIRIAETINFLMMYLIILHLQFFQRYVCVKSWDTIFQRHIPQLPGQLL